MEEEDKKISMQCSYPQDDVRSVIHREKVVDEGGGGGGEGIGEGRGKVG